MTVNKLMLILSVNFVSLFSKFKTMNTLPSILRKNGFEYNLITEGEKSFIYRQLYTKNVSYYEVFEKRIAKPSKIMGKDIPAHIRFPGNEDFGKWAWSYRNPETAQKKFMELENKSLKK